MPDFDAQAEIASLRAMLSDVVANQNRALNTSTSPIETPAAYGASVAPFWDVTLCTGLTLTTASSVDWDVLFDDTSASGWRKVHLATSCGDLDFGTLGIATQRRFSVTWDAKNPAEVKAVLAGFYTEASDTDNPIQIKLNGVMTEYPTATPQFLTLQTNAGRNQLTISTDVRPATVQFYAALWDETRGDSWLDPRTISGYVR